MVGPLFVFSPIENDSIIDVSAIQYRWIYTRYICLFYYIILFLILKRSILFFFALSLPYLSELKQRNVSLYILWIVSLLNLNPYLFLRTIPV